MSLWRPQPHLSERKWAHDAGPPSVCVKVGPIDFGRRAHLYNSGAHGVITRTKSYPAESVDPKVKHFSRMNFDLAELEASDVDPDAWPILTDANGNVTEGTGYNLFIISDGVLRTPGDRNILQGVSRGMIFDLAHQLKLEVKAEDLQPYDVYTADEAFFSSTSSCVLPVTRVDKRAIADAKPGPITNQLLAAWSEHVGLDIADQALRFASS